MTTAKLTEKQRRAMEALEAARKAGMSLSDYAKAEGLAIRELYDAIAALRRRGVLPATDRPRPRKRPFLAVQVVNAAKRVPVMAQPAPRSGMVCRLVQAGGLVIECGEWPPAGWVAALIRDCRDAAP